MTCRSVRLHRRRQRQLDPWQVLMLVGRFSRTSLSLLRFCATAALILGVASGARSLDMAWEGCSSTLLTSVVAAAGAAVATASQGRRRRLIVFLSPLAMIGLSVTGNAEC